MLERIVKRMMEGHFKRLESNLSEAESKILLSNGEVLKRLNELKFPNKLPFNDYEFKVFSQWGDDGLIHFLISNLQLENRYFVEFGVEDYTECNTRFLVESMNWEGLILDGSNKNIQALKSRQIYWKHNLKAEAAFITSSNIEDLFLKHGVPKHLALLHIDIDGNDYWVWEALEHYCPSIVIVEYNATFGPQRKISIPYKEDYVRTEGHFTNLYFGASLPAFNHLATKRGYSFVGCNLAGNNAYFVKKELLNDIVKEVSIQEGFKESKFRESRDKEGKLNFLSGEKRLSAIRGMPVINVESGETEEL